MEKYLDKVSEAYFGKLGTQMAEKTRKRIHWIIKKTSGKKVLDIGCSQGITSILLGREGMNVLGVDIAQEAIDYANESLAKEQNETQENVRFLKGNFLYEEFHDEKFDSVIITEVLEHFISSTEMIKKAHNILNENGNLVVTVPFGINDFPDHKRTLYLAEIYQELSHLFDVQEVEFLGKWVGFVGKKIPQRINDIIPVELIERSERAFYEIERDLLNKNSNLKNQIQKSKEEIQKLKQDFSKLQEKFLESENEKKSLLTKIDSLQSTNEKLEKSKSSSVERLKNLTNELKDNSTIMQGMQNNNNQLQEKLSMLTVKLEYEKKENALNRQDKLELEKSYLDQKRELDKNNRALQTEVEDLKNENSNLLESYNEKVSKLESYVHNLKKELKEKSCDFDSQQQQLSEELSKKQIELEKANNKNVELEALKSKMEINEKKLISKIELINGNAIDLNKKIESLETYSNNLAEEIITIKANSDKEVSRLKDINTKLESELEIVLEISESLKKEIEKLNKENENLINEKQTLIYQNEEVQVKFKTHMDNINQLLLDKNILANRAGIENVKTKEELLDRVATIEKLTEQLISQKKKYEGLRQRYNSLKNSKLGKVTVKYWKLKNKAH